MNSGAAADTAGYYFTKERVTLEERNAGAEKTVPFARQLRAIFTDKYMLIIYAYFLIYTLGTSIKNLSLVYFCNYVLGTYNDGVTQTMISVIGGIPMGSGIFAVWPLAKKFGKRNVMLAGFILYAIGGAICWAFPENMTVILVGQFIKNIGGLPCAYVFMALFADVLDHLEWKTGFCSDGVAMSVYNIIAVAMVGICTGIFNGLLGHAGYIAPEIVNGVTVAAERGSQGRDHLWLRGAGGIHRRDPGGAADLFTGDRAAHHPPGALDYFDASVNRIAAWVTGFRNVQKALLTPDMTAEQNAGDFTDLLVRQEKLKTLPFGEVWAEYCRRCGVPEDGAWLPEVRRYEKTILEARA